MTSTKSNVLKTNNFDINNIEFADPKVGKYGKTINLKYRDPITKKTSPIFLETPRMQFPFGLSKFKKDEDQKKDEDSNFNLNLSFSEWKEGFKTTPDVGNFFNLIETMENKLKKDLFDNSQRLLGKPMKSMDIVEILWYPVIKFAKDKTTKAVIDKYPPNLSLKFPRYAKSKTDNTLAFSTKVFTKESGKDPINLTPENALDVIPPFSEGKVIFQIHSIFCGNNDKMSLTLRANQVKVYQSANKIVAYAFDDSDEEELTDKAKQQLNKFDDDDDDKDEDDDGDNSTKSETNDVADEQDNSNMAGDDSEQESDQVPEPEPEPVKAKKAGRKPARASK